MQLEEALELQREWGNKPCNHPTVVKEYHLGTQTGDYACTTCGMTGWGRDWNKKEKTAE